MLSALSVRARKRVLARVSSVCAGAASSTAIDITGRIGVRLAKLIHVPFCFRAASAAPIGG